MATDLSFLTQAINFHQIDLNHWICLFQLIRSSFPAGIDDGTAAMTEFQPLQTFRCRSCDRPHLPVRVQ